MRNPLGKLGASDEVFINGWAAIPAAFSCEVLSAAGFDGVSVDMQHGLQDVTTMVSCFQGIQLQGAVPTVRVPWNEPGVIGKALDAGAQGIICPMINSAEEARRLVRACYYPPLGERSFGPLRARLYDPVTPGYTERMNEQILCMPMIETGRAIDNLDEILDVEGVKGVYVGPSDLGVTIGLGPGIDREEPEILAAFDKVVAACRKRGQVAGIACGSGAYAARAVGLGFRFVSISVDSTLLQTAAQQQVDRARELIAG